VVLDAGLGLYKLDRYIKDRRPIYVFISHFHLDHIFGLHVLAKFNFQQGIFLCVPRGGRKIIKTLVARPYTAPLHGLKTPIRIIEIGKEGAAEHFGSRLRFLETAKKLLHKDPCFGFRFNFQGTIVTYISDTGVCRNAYRLAKQADLLIAECAFRPGRSNASWPHLNPESAAKIAKAAGAKKLALVHFDAFEYQKPKQRLVAQTAAQKFFPAAFAARDNQTVGI
jgi:ribonuclease BN (tRNA processing enzyme)